MYSLSRMKLILAVALGTVCAVLGAILGVRDTVPEAQQGFVLAVLAIGVIAVAVRRKGRQFFTSGGTAAWAGKAELERAGMLSASTGLILGRVPSDGTPLGSAISPLLNIRLNAKDACRAFFDSLNWLKRKHGQLVRLPQAVHTMAVAPTGVGKGVSCILPFLLTCEDSCVVVDFKGENALLTARHRERMGHRIVLLDPYNVVSAKLKRKPDTFNPFDFIAAGDPLALDQCRDLAEAIVIRPASGDEKDPHWCDSAEAVIGAAAATVVQHAPRDNGQRSLQGVRDILSSPQKWDLAKQVMIEHGGMLARWGGQMEHFRGDELGSVLTTSNRFLRFLDTLPIAASTMSSSFDQARLQKGRMTIYLVLPPEHMRAQSPLLRVWIGSLLRAIVKGGLQEKKKIHFVLDEAAALGHMPALADAVDKYRGYGVRLQFYYQSFGQLKKCWPDDQGQTLLSNTSKIFFGCNDYATAEFLSKSLGPETIVVGSGGSNSGWSRNRGSSSGSSYSESSGSSYSGGSSSNWQQQTRELLKPDEVMQLDPRIAITLTPGVRPVRTRLLRYYEEKSLFKRRGWLGRLTAATWTLCLSAALLCLAAAGALALTREMSTVIRHEQNLQLPPSFNHPPVRLDPVPAPGTRNPA